MTLNLPNFSTVNGVGIIVWEFETVTPLCIKSGSVSLWNQAPSTGGKPAKKLRRVDAEYNFFKKESMPNDVSSSISDFYHGVNIEEHLVLKHEIPASSLRGTLRNYSIKRLIPKTHWNAALFPETEKTESSSLKDIKARHSEKHAEYSKKLKTALTMPGWKLIRNIFGLATDAFDPKIENEAVKGRLQVETGELKTNSKEFFQKNVFDGTFKSFEPGPTNGHMLFTTRNPIDRVTHAAKNGGLHSFTELAPGNRFRTILRFLNPVPTDLGMVALWEQGIKQGLLRLGGLHGAGRGRLNIKSTSINLFLKKSSGYMGIEPSIETSFGEDILGGFYPGFIIPEWETKNIFYLNLLQELFTKLQGEKNNGYA